MIALIFDDYTLSPNPHHFAYMPTFDTTECQLEKRDERVLRQQMNTHNMSFSVPNGPRPRMRRHPHLNPRQFATDDHTSSLVFCVYMTIPFFSPHVNHPL